MAEQVCPDHGLQTVCPECDPYVFDQLNHHDKTRARRALAAAYWQAMQALARVVS